MHTLPHFLGGVKSVFKNKIFGESSVDYNTTGQLLIKYCAFYKYLRNA
jgi:hypothetical protein